MKIVIAGAGDIGFHLASLLSYEQQDITLIDKDQEVLDYAETHLDVFTIKGDSTSVSVLEEAKIAQTDLMLAVTTFEQTNLVSALLAKKMGANQTIARVSNPEYTTPEMRSMFSSMGIDSIISPRLLGAQEIYRLVQNQAVTDIFDFEDGKLTVFGIYLNSDFEVVGQTIGNVRKDRKHINATLIALLRENKTLIPNDEIVLQAEDHLYFLCENKYMQEVLTAMGINNRNRIKRIMITGGKDIGSLTARLLSKDFNVTIVEKDKELCKTLAEHLDDCLVLHGDPSNINLLKEEGLTDMDAFIALTPNTETNVLNSLQAKKLGVPKTIALVENIEYTHLSQSIGIDTIINKKLIAANNIFRYVRKGRIEAITGLHGVDAEIIEFVVTRSNNLTTKPLIEQNFPDGIVIGAIIRGDEIIYPTAETQLALGDKIIVFATPNSISTLEKRFR